MKNTILLIIAAVTLLAMAKPAQAGEITFSDLLLGGTLSSGGTAFFSSNEISFNLPNAQVGDASAAPIGNIVINFVANSMTDMNAVQIQLGMPDLAGSGNMIVHETIIDLQDPISPSILASYDALFSASSPPPLSTNLIFNTPSSGILVIQSITLTAFDTPTSDSSGFGSVKQTFQFIPEPITLIFFLTGIAMLTLLRSRINRAPMF